MLSWNKFRQGWVNYISVYFTTSAFQIIKASQLKLNINSDVKRGDSWKQLLWEWPFPELNVDCSKSKCNVFVDWQPKHAVANSQWPALLRSLKGCCMMIILIWFPSQEISEDNIFLLSSTIIVVIGTFGVVVLCVFCVFLLAGFFIMMRTTQLFLLDSVWTEKVAYRWAFDAVSLSVKRA